MSDFDDGWEQSMDFVLDQMRVQHEEIANYHPDIEDMLQDARGEVFKMAKRRQKRASRAHSKCNCDKCTGI